MKARLLTIAVCVAGLLAGLTGRAAAKTSNGNDFALYFVECRTDEERKELLDDAKGRPHYFRYLQIVEMAEKHKDGRPYVAIVAFEPASCMDVRFFVTKRVSLTKLLEEPTSKPGDAIAVTGVVVGADSSAITLNPVIVRHKDRLHPKRGKELLCEVDPSATFYSYTGGKTPVSLTYKDRDLIKHKDRVIGEGGNQAWTDFLTRELAKRNKARAAAAKAYRAKRQK